NSDSILHITTRQDIQLHYIHIEEAPDMMRRLASVGITTREACGNSVRNVTACEYAGVCTTQAFDVTPYANAITQYLLGHPDVQDFGRKFKIAFSGCEDNPCGLVTFHDLGAVAQVRDGKSAEVSAQCPCKPKCSPSSARRKSFSLSLKRWRACLPASARSRAAPARASSSWCRKLALTSSRGS
ncbi:MAG: hypothetical protein JRF42_13640, partial [Deltaproteobacteria bacterium]|nr:hypothetical protein [Deltaproteobacteria bacterium]